MPETPFNDITELLSQTERRIHKEPCPFLLDKAGNPQVFHFQSMDAEEELTVIHMGGIAGDFEAIRLCLVDQNGKRMMRKGQVKDLHRVDGRLVAWMTTQIQMHCLREPDFTELLEDAEKN